MASPWRFAAVAAVAVAALATTWVLTVPGPVPDPARTAVAPAGPPTAIASPAAAPVMPPAQTFVAREPSVVLDGVMVGADGRSLAVASIDGAPDVLLRVGDPIGSAAQVVAIDSTSMTYRIGIKDVRVSLRPGAATAAARPTASPVGPSGAGLAAAAPPPMGPASGARGSGNEAFREAVQKKMQAITAGRSSP
jgi:hypothetical protein